MGVPFALGTNKKWWGGACMHLSTWKQFKNLQFNLMFNIAQLNPSEFI
jgi:hypothetical protein